MRRLLRLPAFSPGLILTRKIRQLCTEPGIISLLGAGFVSLQGYFFESEKN